MYTAYCTLYTVQNTDFSAMYCTVLYCTVLYYTNQIIKSNSVLVQVIGVKTGV